MPTEVSALTEDERQTPPGHPLRRLSFVALWLAAAGLGCWNISHAAEPRTGETETPEDPADAARQMHIRVHGALADVRRQFRAPPLFPASTVDAIAAGRARLRGWYGAGDRTFRRENGDIVAYGAVAEVEATDPDASSDDAFEAAPFRSCQALFARLEAAAEPRTAGVDDWQITVTPTAIRHDDETIVERDCTERFHCQHAAEGQTVSLDSLVGPLLSYRVVDHSIPCGSDTFAAPSYHTLDLRDGERAPLDALVEPDSLREALLEDSWVREHVPEKKRRRADSLEDLLELPYLRQLHFYSFYDWNAETGEVAMRIWLSEYTGTWTGSHSFVGLWVDLKPEFRQYFEAADQGRGFLMTSPDRPTF